MCVCVCLFHVLLAHLLHFFADLEVDVKELGDTAINAHRLALRKIVLLIILGDALAVARINDAIQKLGSV